eukprot:TRINITY_DN1056_c0_g1_i10.p3 TRINITY_DN1056_c0_g1~~TRINITY_DN1056_c0_g1_i10.p3  ORF type:complete len:106 (+),score=23.82 TRINITY_DN1056_c0_g1_i10:902-1219(+)
MKEIKLYDPTLLTLPRVILANKLDVRDSKVKHYFQEMVREFPEEHIIPISAEENKNINTALRAIQDLYLQAREKEKQNKKRVLSWEQWGESQGLEAGNDTLGYKE